MAEQVQRVLIVDDEPLNLKVLMYALQKENYKVLLARSGVQALKISESDSPPDIILLDIMMPEMDGYEVCTKLKSNFKTRDIPVMFLTAVGKASDEYRGFKMGAVDYIVKPFSPAIVQARIRTHLELKQYREDLERKLFERTEQFARNNKRLRGEIRERKKAEQELLEHQAHLEETVEKRTTELKKANRQLKKEIDERKRIAQDLKLAKNEAIAANQSKSLFLASMSHEIRTPMNAIVGMTELLLSSKLGSKQYGYVEVLRYSSDTLLSIIDDILDFSKIEAGKLELMISDFDIKFMLNNVVDMLAVKAQEKGLDLIHRIQSDVPTILAGDAQRLRQSLINLVGNAIKFTQKGEIIVHLSLEKETQTYVTVRFDVTDTGVGIPKENINRLFKEYSQADAATSGKFGGTGLGLALSKRFAALMNGRIGVESEEGVGSNFWFTAVLKKKAEGQLTVVEMPSESHPGINDETKKAISILVVDDNSINRQLVIEMLTSMGFAHVDAVENGREAVRILESRYYGLVLMDVQMPVMDGLEATRIIRGPDFSGPGKDVPIIALTANAMKEDREACLKAGMTEYLSKPIRSQKLLEIIEKLAPEILSNMPAEHDMAFPGTSESSVTASSRKTETPSDTVFGTLATPACSPPEYELTEEKLLDRRVLVVDDNDISQETVLIALFDMGFRDIDTLGSGENAVNAVQMIRYDLVLMDVQMPRMNGLKAVRKIREIQTGDDAIPIVGMTSKSSKEDINRILNAGMNDFVVKPIDPNRLRTVVARQLAGAENPGAGYSGTNVYGWEKALDHVDGNEALLHKMAEMVVREFPLKLKDLCLALDQQNDVQARLISHSMKGNASIVQAESFGKVASEIEKAARNKDLEKANSFIEELKIEFERLKNALAADGRIAGGNSNLV